MVSLPRDSYVWLYNKNYRGKINSAFSAGGGYEGKGFEYAKNTVSMLFGGIPVNHYVCFDMNVVKEVVNAIGGLYYDVDIHVDMCGRTIEPGYQYLDGQKVLDYCRTRHGATGGSDVERTKRQRRMILAIFDEIKKNGQIQEIPEIYSAVTGNIYTDLAFNQIVSLAAFAMKLDLDDIHEYNLEGGFLNIDGSSFWGIDQYKKRDMILEIFGKEIRVSKDDHVTTLQALAAKKREAVAAANSAASRAERYVERNKEYIKKAERSDFKARTADLRAVAAVKNTADVGPTIQPIINATESYNVWFAAFKATIEERKHPAPTPTPEPDPTRTPKPDVSTPPDDAE